VPYDKGAGFKWEHLISEGALAPPAASATGGGGAKALYIK